MGSVERSCPARTRARAARVGGSTRLRRWRRGLLWPRRFPGGVAATFQCVRRNEDAAAAAGGLHGRKFALLQITVDRRQGQPAELAELLGRQEASWLCCSGEGGVVCHPSTPAAGGKVGHGAAGPCGRTHARRLPQPPLFSGCRIPWALNFGEGTPRPWLPRRPQQEESVRLNERGLPDGRWRK